MAFPTSRPVDWSLETWPTAVIATAVRHDLDDAKIASLVESVRQGGELPPIFVLIDGQRVVILDGHHRVAAWIVLGFPRVPVIAGKPR